MRADYYSKPRIIDEEALPAGVFPGSSKMTFDTLVYEEHEATRSGRPLQITRDELRRRSGLKSMKTLAAHLAYFRGLSLVTVTPGGPGDHQGNFYKVNLDRLPEAIERARATRPKLLRPRASTRPAPARA